MQSHKIQYENYPVKRKARLEELPEISTHPVSLMNTYQVISHTEHSHSFIN